MGCNYEINCEGSNMSNPPAAAATAGENRCKSKAGTGTVTRTYREDSSRQ